MADLFDSLLLGGTVPLKSRIVMAPMTRTRTSEGDVPNQLMARYRGQRSSAGLIASERLRRPLPMRAGRSSKAWKSTPPTAICSISS